MTGLLIMSSVLSFIFVIVGGWRGISYFEALRTIDGEHELTGVKQQELRDKLKTRTLKDFLLTLIVATLLLGIIKFTELGKSFACTENQNDFIAFLSMGLACISAHFYTHARSRNFRVFLEETVLRTDEEKPHTQSAFKARDTRRELIISLAVFTIIYGLAISFLMLFYCD